MKNFHPRAKGKGNLGKEKGGRECENTEKKRKIGRKGKKNEEKGRKMGEGKENGGRERNIGERKEKRGREKKVEIMSWNGLRMGVWGGGN